MNTTSLREKAMLLSLSVSVWNPKKTDKVATLETLIKHNASRDAGNFVKNILPEGAIDRVKKAEGALRNYVYAQSLPWLEGGIRILPSELYFEFTAEYGKLKNEFESAVGDFLLNYDAHRERAKIALNGLFKDSDYPAVEFVRDKFGVRLTCMPVPDGSDFRVDLPEDIKAGIANTLNESNAVSISTAKEAILERVSKALTAVANRLSEPDPLFRDSLINNVREVATMIPKLNVMGDQSLLHIAADLESVAKFEPQEIRDDETKKEEARKAASDILTKMGIKL
jgi:hypothetical protein